MSVCFRVRDAHKQGTVSTTKLVVAGIDPSTYTGLVVLGDKVLHAEVLHFTECYGYARLQSIADGVLGRLVGLKLAGVFIERPITSGVFNNQIQTQIATLIRDRLYSAGLTWWDVSPTTLKKWLTGKGNATKNEMAGAVKSRWEYVHKSDDIIDAYALAQIGRHVLVTGGAIKGVDHAGQ